MISANAAYETQQDKELEFENKLAELRKEHQEALNRMQESFDEQRMKELIRQNRLVTQKDYDDQKAKIEANLKHEYREKMALASDAEKRILADEYKQKLAAQTKELDAK
ncbi:MAG: hypothetical protein J6W64_01505 [Bacilli bacterium]|nr:hypothetical protein [Bacilli bacterium]